VYKVGEVFVCREGEARRGGICSLLEGNESRDAVCTKEGPKHSERLNMPALRDFKQHELSAKSHRLLSGI
jgi:hypothetical protein